MGPNASPQLRVLVVDDEEMMRNTLKRILEALGYLVEVAGNASNALKALEDSRFDLVITDYDMAGMKGDALAAAIKTRHTTLPVLMVTANLDTMGNNPSAVKNLDGLVTKPFRMETLREAIDRAFASRRLPPGSPGV
jgi:DNA-binding NtrC family response regulator